MPLLPQTCKTKLVRTAQILLAFAFAALALQKPATGQEIRIAAAADLQFAMKDLSTEFTAKSGIKISVTYGSSGNFFSQIQNGAPFDMFFSADLEHPQKLKAGGFVEPDGFQAYAIGQIVVWAPADSPLKPESDYWHVLTDSQTQRIAIANPEHAPYGRAAVAALKSAGLYDAVKAKLVYGENISQAAQFVQSGNTQAGIIALSLALSPGMAGGKMWQIPAELHPPIEQAAVILRSATNKDAARSFLRFVKSPPGEATLVKYGFAVPPATSPAPAAHKT